MFTCGSIFKSVDKIVFLTVIIIIDTNKFFIFLKKGCFMKKKILFTLLSISFSSAMEKNSAEFALHLNRSIHGLTGARAYIQKNGKKAHAQYKNIADGSLFNRMMQNDQKTLNSINDVGRLTAVAYNACAAEGQKIRETKAFQDAIDLFKKLADVLDTADSANDKNIFELIQRLNSGSYKKNSNENVNTQLATTLSELLKQDDISKILIGLYNELDKNQKIEEKKPEIEKIKKLVESKFNVLGDTFLNTINQFNTNAQKKYDQNNDKHNNTKDKEENLKGVRKHLDITMVGIKSDLKKIVNVLKEGLEDTVSLYSSKRSQEILDKYKTSDNKSLDFIDSVKRSEADDNLSAVFFHNKKTNVVDINCLGTHNLYDWVYNIDFLKSKGNLFNTLGFGNNTHGGFAALSNHVYEAFNKNEKIKELIENGATIRVAGHSLGGAMAQVLATQLRKEHEKKVSLVTFCQPPAFDANEANDVSKEFAGDYLRFYNPMDIVHHSLFNFGDLLPGNLDLWYKHAGIGIGIEQDFLTKVQNLLKPVINAHNINNNIGALPNTLETYIEENKEVYKAYKQLETEEEKISKRENAIDYLNCLREKGGQYEFKTKEDSKAPLAREKATLKMINFEFEKLKKEKVSFNPSEFAKKITSFATVVLEKSENIPGDNVGQFTREILQTLNKHISKKTNFNAYTKYREQIITALKKRFKNYDDEKARDTLSSIAHLYKKDFEKLTLKPENSKDVKAIKSAVSKINFLKKEVKRMENKLNAKDVDLTISQYGMNENKNEDLDKTIKDINVIIKESESKLYYACNNALAVQIKEQKKRTDAITFAREISKLGVEIDSYHYTNWSFRYQGPQSVKPESALEKLMQYHNISIHMTNKAVEDVKTALSSEKEGDDMDGLSDNEEEFEVLK